MIGDTAIGAQAMRSNIVLLREHTVPLIESVYADVVNRMEKHR